LWDPEATIHPLTDARRRAARDELQAAIADLTIWIERAPPPSAKRSIQGPVDADIGTTARRSDGTAG